MYLCPRCHRSLNQKVDTAGVFWCCPDCAGIATGFGALRRSFGEKRMASFWSEALSSPQHTGCVCFSCTKPMINVTVDVEGTDVTLDICRVCNLVWFDAGEFESIPPAPPKPHVLGEIDWSKLSPEMREKLAMTKVQQIADDARRDNAELDSSWKAVPAALGLPVEIETSEVQRTPWATFTVSIVIFVASVIAFAHLRQAINTYGLIPSEFWREHGLTFLTSFFLHVGIFHLLGNLYFLLLFGRLVENDLGPWRLLLLLALAHLTGGLLHIALDPRGYLPLIGASGGISGVLAYYAFKFPQTQMGFFFWWGFRWVAAPAWVFFALWILFQLIGAALQYAGLSSVSSLGHLGGVVVGVIFWIIFRQRPAALREAPSRGAIVVKVQ